MAIDGQPGKDSREPTADAGLLPEVGKRREAFHIGFVHEVLGVPSVPGQPGSEPVEMSEVRQRQRLERLAQFVRLRGPLRLG